MTKDRSALSQMTVQAIKDGTAIDHIPANMTLKVVQMLSGFEDEVTIGVNFPSSTMGRKGVVKIANKALTKEEVNRIAIFAPQATVNIIQDYKVVRKLRVELPGELCGIINCSNPNCITNHEEVATRFYTSHGEHTELRCHHCERLMPIEEVQML
jgi:aspartate carbamoyltransferase regulatory subunit